MSVVLGLDLSLTSTGLAVMYDGVYEDWANPKTKGKKDDTYVQVLDRIDYIAGEVYDFVHRCHTVELAVIEAPSHGSSFGSPHERAGLWWRVVQILHDLRVPIAQIAPKSRQKYITGNGGNLGKDAKKVVLAHAIDHWVTDDTPAIPNDDVADALGLADMGARHLGDPCVELPAANLASMGVVKWPTTIS